MAKAGRLFIKSQLLTFFLVLCALGFWVGFAARPEQGVPFRSVRGYDGAVVPRSDTTARFSRSSWRTRTGAVRSRRAPLHRADADVTTSSIGGSARYRPLTLRGHVGPQALELPDSTRPKLPGGSAQRAAANKSSDLRLKPVGSRARTATLSGYYRLPPRHTWAARCRTRRCRSGYSRCGMDRVIAHEAWRRVLLEPVLMGDERRRALRRDARHATAIHQLLPARAERQRRLHPREGAARLARSSARARAMRVRHRGQRAAQDTIDLRSSDFSAIEGVGESADHRGHWSPARRHRRAKSAFATSARWRGTASHPRSRASSASGWAARAGARGATRRLRRRRDPAHDVGCPAVAPVVDGGGVGSGGNDGPRSGWAARASCAIVEMGIGITRQLRGQR